MGKFGPAPGREGTPLYPGFYRTVPPGTNRTARLETGSQRMQRGSIRPTAGQYVRMPKSALFTAENSTQFLDLSHTRILKIGGVSVHGTIGFFGYTSTDHSITWYWDGTNGSTVPVIKRADGTSFTVPTTGSGFTVTGLSASTDYYFLPFWNVSNVCNLGWVQGTVGTPQIAFVLADTTSANSSAYLLLQSLQDNEPMSAGFMKATTASGGGTGGGGSPGCVRSGSAITTLGDLPYECEVLRESEWVYLTTEGGRELYCTYDHPLYHALRGKVPADSLTSGEVVITDKGEDMLTGVQFYSKACSKYRVHMPKGHLFFANGFLSHNQKIGP